MSYEFDFVDAYGTPIAVGDRVRVSRMPSEEPCPTDYGVVTSLCEPEGDADDEGRPIGIPPSVEVDFDLPGYTEEQAAEWAKKYPRLFGGQPWTAERFTGSCGYNSYECQFEEIVKVPA